MTAGCFQLLKVRPTLGLLTLTDFSSPVDGLENAREFQQVVLTGSVREDGD